MKTSEQLEKDRAILNSPTCKRHELLDLILRDFELARQDPEVEIDLARWYGVGTSKPYRCDLSGAVIRYTAEIKFEDWLNQFKIAQVHAENIKDHPWRLIHVVTAGDAICGGYSEMFCLYAAAQNRAINGFLGTDHTGWYHRHLKEKGLSIADILRLFEIELTWPFGDVEKIVDAIKEIRDIYQKIDL